MSDLDQKFESELQKRETQKTMENEYQVEKLVATRNAISKLKHKLQSSKILSAPDLRICNDETTFILRLQRPKELLPTKDSIYPFQKIRVDGSELYTNFDVLVQINWEPSLGYYIRRNSDYVDGYLLQSHDLEEAISYVASTLASTLEAKRENIRGQVRSQQQENRTKLLRTGLIITFFILAWYLIFSPST